jgi:hypothetical protein
MMKWPKLIIFRNIPMVYAVTPERVFDKLIRFRTKTFL